MNISNRFAGRLLCLLTLVTLGPVARGADAPPAKDLRVFYQQHCAGCHGVDGAARDVAGKRLRGQDFTDPRWLKQASDATMAKVILKGLFFGYAMPSFKHLLTEEDALRLVREVIRGSEKGKPIGPAVPTR